MKKTDTKTLYEERKCEYDYALDLSTSFTYILPISKCIYLFGIRECLQKVKALCIFMKYNNFFCVTSFETNVKESRAFFANVQSMKKISMSYFL